VSVATNETTTPLGVSFKSPKEIGQSVQTDGDELLQGLIYQLQESNTEAVASPGEVASVIKHLLKFCSTWVSQKMAEQGLTLSETGEGTLTTADGEKLKRTDQSDALMRHFWQSNYKQVLKLDTSRSKQTFEAILAEFKAQEQAKIWEQVDEADLREALGYFVELSVWVRSSHGRLRMDLEEIQERQQYQGATQPLFGDKIEAGQDCVVLRPRLTKRSNEQSEVVFEALVMGNK